jgi:hypothetical protein
MVERVIDKASMIAGELSIRIPQMIDEKELYGC